jgi:hypothetical protein
MTKKEQEIRPTSAPAESRPAPQVLSYSVPQPDQRPQSMAGNYPFFWGLLALLALGIDFGLSAIIGDSEADEILRFVYLLFPFCGFILGIVGLFPHSRKRTVAFAGLTFNGLWVVGVIRGIVTVFFHN